jgi:protein-S-isoprenylcysteine O-methyltransferase Ste14
VWVLVWLGPPFLVGALLGAAFAKGWWSTAAVAALGVGLGFGVVLWAYYAAPPGGAPYNGCSDCENFLGRWWEPNFTILLVVIGYLFWLLGIGAGVGARSLLRRGRTPIETNL